MDQQIFHLPNGLTVIHQQIKETLSGHCGFLVNVGTRDEGIGQEGMAHFMEHMLFKGTQKRRAFHINSRLDNVGADLNAYTTKEKTCFYASFIHHHTKRAVELLTDITFHSIFPINEIEKEKGVVLDEISLYYDNFEETIYEDFEEKIFENGTLGKKILGNATSVANFNQEALLKFYKNYYTPENMVFSYVGNLTLKEFQKIANPILLKIEPAQTKHQRIEAHYSKPFEIEAIKHNHQSYICYGGPGYSLKNEKRSAMVMMLNILGGDAANSRLNLSVREKNGLVYQIDANSSPYTDAGVVSINFSCEPKKSSKVMRLVKQEMKKMRTTKLGKYQLQVAKQQLISGIIMSEENRASLMIDNAKAFLDHGSIKTLPEIFARINAISEIDILEVANEVLDENQLSLLVFQPQ